MQDLQDQLEEAKQLIHNKEEQEAKQLIRNNEEQEMLGGTEDFQEELWFFAENTEQYQEQRDETFLENPDAETQHLASPAADAPAAEDFQEELWFFAENTEQRQEQRDESLLENPDAEIQQLVSPASDAIAAEVQTSSPWRRFAKGLLKVACCVGIFASGFLANTIISNSFNTNCCQDDIVYFLLEPHPAFQNITLRPF